MFEVVPDAVRPGLSGDWTRLKVDAANGVLARDVVGQRARIAARVQAVGVAPGKINSRYAGLPRMRLRQDAIGEMPVTLYAYFPADAKEQAAAINPGDEVLARGTISRAQLTQEPNGHGVRLNIDLTDCRPVK